MGEALPDPTLLFSRKSKLHTDTARNTNPSQVFDWSAAHTVKRDHVEITEVHHHHLEFWES